MVGLILAVLTFAALIGYCLGAASQPTSKYRMYGGLFGAAVCVFLITIILLAGAL